MGQEAIQIAATKDEAFSGDEQNAGGQEARLGPGAAQRNPFSGGLLRILQGGNEGERLFDPKVKGHAYVQQLYAEMDHMGG